MIPHKTTLTGTEIQISSIFKFHCHGCMCYEKGMYATHSGKDQLLQTPALCNDSIIYSYAFVKTQEVPVIESCALVKNLLYKQSHVPQLWIACYEFTCPVTS